MQKSHAAGGGISNIEEGTTTAINMTGTREKETRKGGKGREGGGTSRKGPFSKDRSGCKLSEEMDRGWGGGGTTREKKEWMSITLRKVGIPRLGVATNRAPTRRASSKNVGRTMGEIGNLR